MNNIIGTKIGNLVNLVIDGNAWQKTFESQDEANAFFKLIHKARTGDKDAFNELLTALNRRYKTVINGILEKDSDENYYLKGIDIKLPSLLADTFVDYIENDFPVDALVNFWKLLLTNPDPRVREDLFKFLQEYNFAITDNGYFVAYKAVEAKNTTGEDLAAFVSNQYLKIKKWKKNPANYEVARILTEITEEVENPAYEYFGDIDDEDDENYGQEDNGEDEFIEETRNEYSFKLFPAGEINLEDDQQLEKVYGNLSDLFKNIDSLIDNRTVYQSKHSGKNGKVEQVLGVPVKMERIETNVDPKVECSSGLHVGSTKYVENFSSGDDRILQVLVNPAHVVAVPEYDNSKLRTCEYFPYAELGRKEDSKEFEVLESPYFEDEYMKYEKADLEAQLADVQPGREVSEDAKVNYKKILEERVIYLEGALKK